MGLFGQFWSSAGRILLAAHSRLGHLRRIPESEDTIAFVQVVNRSVLDASAPAAMGRQVTVLSRLTQREREVARLVRDGLSNEEISQQLRKGMGTVKNQLRSVFRKLEINSRAKLISLLR